MTTFINYILDLILVLNYKTHLYTWQKYSFVNILNIYLQIFIEVWNSAPKTTNSNKKYFKELLFIGNFYHEHYIVYMLKCYAVQLINVVTSIKQPLVLQDNFLLFFSEKISYELNLVRKVPVIIRPLFICSKGDRSIQKTVCTLIIPTFLQ